MLIDPKYLLAIININFALFFIQINNSEASPIQHEIKPFIITSANDMAKKCKTRTEIFLATEASLPPDLWDFKIDKPPCIKNESKCEELLKYTQKYSYQDFKRDLEFYVTAYKRRDIIVELIKRIPTVEEERFLSNEIKELDNECSDGVERLRKYIVPMVLIYHELK